MATYIPNAVDTTQPVESQTVESAALEFRTLKARVNGVENDLEFETSERIAEDQNIIDMVSPFITGLVGLAFLNPMDLGSVLDVPVGQSLDLGTV